MCCLYCGKEIGAFRLFRDSEFCSDAHRNNYRARLNRALHEMAAPTLAPASVAGHLVRWPVLEGACVPRLGRWQSGSDYPLLLPGLALAAAQYAGDSVAREPVPPPCQAWMPGPRPEPVACLVGSGFARSTFLQDNPAGSLRWPVALLRFSVIAESGNRFVLTTHVPPPSGDWMRKPAPEPVVRLVVPRMETALLCLVRAVRLPSADLAPALPALAPPAETIAPPAETIAPPAETIASPAEPIVPPAPCEAWMPL